MTLARDMTIPIQCPQCRRKIAKRLNELKAHRQFTCTCGASFHVANRDFEQAGRAIQDFEKSLAKLGRNIRLKI